MRNTILFLTVSSLITLTSCGNYEKTDNAQLETDISPVIPKINSSVVKVLVEDNQEVKEGDTLIVLDDEMQKIAVQQAEVALLQAKQNVSLSSNNKGVAASSSSSVAANMIAAKANVDAARVRYELAVKNYDRYKTLLDQKSATQQQFDGVRAEKETAEKLLRVAEGQTVSLQKQIETTQASVASSSEGVTLAQIAVKQAENNLASAKLLLSYCVLKAPSDGVVSKKSVQVGQVVAAGQPLMAITNNKKVWVVANYKETQLEKMKVGQTATVKVDAYPGEEFEAKVTSISYATGAKFSLLPQDNATGNFVKVTQRIPVKLIFSGNKQLQYALRAGMNVEVKIKTD